MKRFPIFVFFLAILMLSRIPSASAQSQFPEAGVDNFRVAVEAPDFMLKDLGGEKISLRDLRGKIILLNFFATW